MEEKNIFSSLKKSQAFIFGIIAGFLVICTIGFFVLLGLVLSGNVGMGGNNDDSVVAVGKAKKFNECLDTGKYATAVTADADLGGTLGVQGTPATFINGYLISGAYPYVAVKQVIDDSLAGKDPAANWDTENYGELTKTNMPEFKDAVWYGNEKSTVTLVEFSDFECPYCNRFYDTMEQILAEYKDKVKFTYRHFPLSFHVNAQKAAEAFECAKEQGKTWEMYDELFALSKSSTMSVDNFKKAADEIGLK